MLVAELLITALLLFYLSLHVIQWTITALKRPNTIVCHILRSVRPKSAWNNSCHSRLPFQPFWLPFCWGVGCRLVLITIILVTHTRLVTQGIRHFNYSCYSGHTHPIIHTVYQTYSNVCVCVCTHIHTGWLIWSLTLSLSHPHTHIHSLSLSFPYSV